MRISRRRCYETVVSVCFGSGEKTRFLGEIFGALFISHHVLARFFFFVFFLS